MTELATEASAFYRNVAARRRLWTVRDSGGFPAPVTASGQRAQPYWSTRALAEYFIERVPAYRGFEVVELTWEDFRDRWVPGLAAGQVLIGIDWRGPALTGADYGGAWVCECVEIEIAKIARAGGPTRPTRPERSERPAQRRPERTTGEGDGMVWFRRIFSRT
jgi:hypothetical protein